MSNKVLTLALGVLLLTLSFSAEAQQTGKIFRIGILDPSTASGSAVLLEAFRQELTKLGWIEGKTIIVEYRFGENKGSERLVELAAELVRLKVDLIVATAGAMVLAAKAASLNSSLT
jgi:putative ABC transport system substrate-binding protein